MRALVGLIFLVLFTAGASAQSCGTLKSQLASAKAGQPNGAVVASIERKSRSYGCDNRGRNRHQACAGIDAQLRQAKAGGVNLPRVRRLERQIETHCAEQKGWSEAFRSGPRRETKGNRRGNFLANLFGRRNNEPEFETVDVDPRNSRPAKGVERVSLDPQDFRGSAGSSDNYSALATRSRGHAKGSSRVGNKRTMCVRLCDGFYFPINNESHSDNYYDELAMCVGRCPGADVSLYEHSNGQAVEQMRSTMTGEAYVNLPTAFAYRKKLSPSCSCANGTQLVRGGDEAPKMSLASLSTGEGASSDAKDEARWAPFRAVYDETGKPLVPSSTLHGAVPATVGTEPQVDIVVIPPRPETQEGNVGVDFNPYDNSARRVGPQFFSQSVVEFAVKKKNPQAPRQRFVAPTIITVTPLPRDQRAKTEAAPVPAADTPVEEIAPGTSAMVQPAGVGG